MKVERTCKTCGKLFLKEKKYVNRGQGRFCSRSCKSKGRFADPNRFEDGKVCGRCKQLKQLPEFSISTSERRIVTSWCKQCAREHNNKKYRESDRIKRLAQERRLRYRERNRLFLWEIISHSSCADCGEDDPLVLEFDHLDRGSKSFNIGWATSACVPLSRLSEEMSKCDIVCANCHRRRTASQNGSYRARLVLKDGIEPPAHTASMCRSTTELLEPDAIGAGEENRTPT